jgi:UDP-glucose 4-epimerase
VPIAEDARLDPVNAYGASKLVFEQLLELFGGAHGLRAVRFRYFNVAGAVPDGTLGEAHDPETHIIPRVLGAMAAGQERFEVFGNDYPTPDGTCVCDYVHVCDLARAHRLGLEALHAGEEGGVYNLGNCEGFSNLEVVRTCAEVTGRDVSMEFGPRRPGDPAVLVACADRAEAAFRWRAERTALSQIVSDAWRWHRRHAG